jgi:hypothetical protein
VPGLVLLPAISDIGGGVQLFLRERGKTPRSSASERTEQWNGSASVSGTLQFSLMTRMVRWCANGTSFDRGAKEQTLARRSDGSGTSSLSAQHIACGYTAGGKGCSPGLRLLSRTSPATPARMNRSCQRQTQGLDTSAWRMIAVVPQPAAVARMIFARQTCFCGLFRSATTRSSRPRSAALTSMLIPSRMPQHATHHTSMESYDCVRPLAGC